MSGAAPAVTDAGAIAELQERMRTDGLDFDRYRSSLREQILIQRVREREVTPRIQISEEEVNSFLASDPAAQTESALNLAHILIKVPEQASPQDVQKLQAKAEDIQRKAAAAKLFASETCGRVVDRCVQVYGGAGYLAEYPAERFFRDARILRIYEGTSQIMQLQIAKHLLREFASEGTVW